MLMAGVRRRSLRALGTAVAAFAVATAAMAGPAGPANNVVGATDTVPGDTSDAEIGSDAFTGEASRFIPITPIRALDTRATDDYGKVFGDSAISIDPVTNTGVASAAGVDPDDISAVIVNVTMVQAGGPGFATVWATGSPRLTTATNNSEFTGQNIGNLVIAPLGLERKISFYASTDADVTVDVLGVFAKSGATDAGRFEQLGPVRHTDTREGTPMGAGETRTFDLTSAGVPADATGVVMNITAFQANGKGFYTVWAADTPKPNTANINVLSQGYSAGNQVVSGLTDGRISVFTDIGSQLTIDVTGYFTEAGGEPATDGLFVPFSPARFLDTREESGANGLNGGAPLRAGERFTLELTGRGDVPEVGVKAVALNVTGNQTGDRGFIKVFAAGASEPPTSSLNFTAPGQTVPNHGIASIDTTSGSVDLLPDVDVHAIVDASGYFLSDLGVVPAAGGPLKTVDPGSFVPSPLGAAPAAAPYDFLFDRSMYVDSSVRPNPTVNTRYSACAPLRYALNVDLANDEEIADLIASIENVELYSGVDLQYAGVTSGGMNIADELLLPERDGLPYRYLPPGADVVIGYASEQQVDSLDGGIIGVGGGLRLPADERMFRGFAVIDLPDLDNSAERRATTTHELGHMMGLGHISDFDPRSGAPSTAYQGLDPNSGTWDGGALRAQLMYPTLNPNNTTFAGGDALGLWELYGTQQCGNALIDPDHDAGQKAGQGVDWSSVEIASEY